ncbi:MAG: hypothetical protein HS108_09520 [Planctomycetes bacterium]|jgi:hypothetical protein|nr:hypothetical protein [Planctomycetota bacterium]MCL4730317.1 hypothetical protein [Planctomycetota bacterium]
MPLSPTAVKYLAIGILVLLGAMFIGALLWDILKIALGLLIGLGLIYLGLRFLAGKGLPRAMEDAAKKVVDAGKDGK